MKKIWGLFLILALFSIGFASKAEDLEKPIMTYHLNNGHKVIIKEIYNNPIVTIDTWVKTGTVNETPKINGVSHFLEHLMFKGTKTHKNGEIERILESKGARCNAATSKDYTHYYVTIASDYVDTAIKLHADMMQNPAIPKEELKKERKVVQEEIRRANDNPQRILLNNLFRLMFKKHPYKMDTLGPHEVIETISRKEIFNYYNTRYIPSNLTTVIVGDVDTQKVLSLMRKSFNKEAQPSKKVVFKREPNITKPVEKVVKGNYKSGYAFWGFKGVPVASIKESYALDMAASILGGSMSSRLYQNIKEDKDLVSAISAMHYSLRDDSVFIVSADFEPDKFEKVKAAILEEIENIRDNPVTPEELERVKTLAKRSFIYETESVENIANAIGYAETVVGNIDSYKKHIQYVESVTATDIQKAAQKYLAPNKLALSVILPDEVPVNLVLKDKKTIKDNTKSKLNNGMTLITNKNTTNDIVSMNIFVKGGVFTEPMPGTAAVLSRTLMYGTKGRPYLKLIKEIEDLGISISPVATNDYFEISLKSTKEDFDRAFDLLVDIVQNPRFEKRYIEKNKNNLLVKLKKAKDRPLSLALNGFIENMYIGHPYGHKGKVLEENLHKLDRESVVEYWGKYFIPENMVVSVSGNLEHKDIAYKLLENFSASGKEAPEVTYKGEFSQLDKNKIVFTKKKSEATWMFLGWPVGNIEDNREYASFRVMEAILSNGLSSRLHRKFREEQGLAYRVGASYSPKKDKGHFMVYIGTAPKNVDLVKAKFLAEIERLKDEPVSREELAASKSKLIGSYALSQETNESKAHLLGLYEVVDKEFGFNYDFPDLINKVTSEDIIRVANKYFSYPYVLSVAGPQSTEQKE